MNRSFNTYLFDAVKKLDFKNFLEREAGVSFERSGQSWKCSCPLHRENTPSFTLKLEANSVYVFHCWGCGAKGTIIDFCMAFFNETNPWKAALLIAEKEGVKLDESVVLKAIQNATVQDNRVKDLMISHFVTSYLCQNLLRACNKDEKTMSWVAKAYAAMNKILDDASARSESFSLIGAEAERRLLKLVEEKR